MSINKNKDEDIKASTITHINAITIGENKDINYDFDIAVIGKIYRNKEKQLNIRKCKLFVTIINYKRSYLLKKI